MHTVFIVQKTYPDIFDEIERVFFSEKNAHHYIQDTYPYYSYYKDHDFYALPDLTDKELETEERYLILERPVMDDLILEDGQPKHKLLT